MPELRTVESLGLPVVGSEPAALDGGVVVESSRVGGGQMGHNNEAVGDGRLCAGRFAVHNKQGSSAGPRKRSLRGNFVDMAELLCDNLEADRHEAKGADGRLASRREAPELLSWMQCFGIYVCVVASWHPKSDTPAVGLSNTYSPGSSASWWEGHRTTPYLFKQQAAVSSSLDWSILNITLYAGIPSRIRQLLAYQTLIVREARRLGGRGTVLLLIYLSSRQQCLVRWTGRY